MFAKDKYLLWLLQFYIYRPSSLNKSESQSRSSRHIWKIWANDLIITFLLLHFCSRCVHLLPNSGICFVLSKVHSTQNSLCSMKTFKCGCFQQKLCRYICNTVYHQHPYHSSLTDKTVKLKKTIIIVNAIHEALASIEVSCAVKISA